MEIEKLKENITEITDPRRTDSGNYRHKLEDIIVIGLCTVICGGEDYEDMEEFGTEREEWLRAELKLELPHGIPRSITFRRVYEVLKPEELGRCLNKWTEVERVERGVVPIDGKTIRGSSNDEHRAIHVVSAWASENYITLGEIKTDEHSKEITAVPELIDLIDVEGAIVTAACMSCQTAIVKKIAEDKKADYVITLKGNQEKLHEAVAEYFMFKAESATCKTKCIEETGHGRLEKREYWLETDISWLEQKDEWSNLKAIGMVKTEVERKGNVTFEIRYFIASLTDIDEFAYAVRQHWSIENQLHWCLDVIFREDSARARKDNSPQNMNILRKKALSLLKNANMHSRSLRKKMFKAALNTTVLECILFT